MTPWLTLSLGLWLGQTPEAAPPLPSDAEIQDPAAIELREAWERALQNVDATDEGQEATEGTVEMPALDVTGTANGTAPSAAVAGGTPPQPAPEAGTVGIGGAGPAGASDDAQAQAATGNTQAEVAQLRAQVQQLQAQVNSIQQQLAGTREKAAELERMRQQLLAEIERAGTWLVAADQALAVGELAVGDALQEVDAALAQMLQSATEAGDGRTVTLVEDARVALLRAREAVGRRDTAQARWDLFAVSEALREARRQNLDEPSATTVTR
jgi:hypothetical protein